MAWNYRVIKAKHVIGCTGMGPVIKGRRKICLLEKQAGLHVGLEFPTTLTCFVWVSVLDPGVTALNGRLRKHLASSPVIELAVKGALDWGSDGLRV